MDELEPTARDLPTEQEQEVDPITIPDDWKPLYITPDTKGIDYRGLLGELVQYFSMGDILSKMKAGTQFMVQIPTEFQAAFEAGKLHMMQNQTTGIMRPALVKIAENGKHTIVCNLPVTEQPFVQGNPIQDLAAGYQNLLMQQQMKALSEKLDAVLEAAARIEEGQMNDRLADFDSGRNNLAFALSAKNNEEKLSLIRSGRNDLIKAQAKVGRAMKALVNSFEPIPEGPVNLYFRELKKSGYLRGKDQEFHLIQEYYDYYLKATKLIAVAFIMCNEPDLAEQAFNSAKDFLSQVDFSRVRTIQHMHKELTDTFCTTPIKYLSVEKENFLEEAQEYDYVEIEVSKQMLLEALNDGRERTIQDSGTEQ